MSPQQLDAARSSFFDRSLDLLCLADDTYFLEINDSWQRTLGWTREQMLARPYVEFVHPDDVEPTRDAARALVDGEQVIQFRNRYRTASGGYRWLEWMSYVDPEHEVVFGVARDVTREQELESTLRAVNAELRARAELRDQFIATASHELRTPVTSIVGFARTIRDFRGRLDAGQVDEFVSIIAEQGDRLLRVVDSLLSMARLDAGVIPVASGVVDVRDAFGAAARLLPPEDVRMACDDPVRVIADRALLDQVLANLVTNAIRYGGPPVELGARIEGDRVRIHVRDHGEGVPEAFRPYLFEKFAQARRGLTEPVHGTGLGLAITRGLVEAMGGSIEHEPADPGSSFVVRLPSASG